MKPMTVDQPSTAILRTLGMAFAMMTMAIRWRAWIA
jgi:hypothetical protein